MDAHEFDDLMTRVAWLYHQRGWTQEQIAQKFRVSRATVARVLQRAIQEGLVRICFAEEPERRMLLEEQLSEKFGLQEVVLVPGNLEATPRRIALAKALAAYLERTLEDGTVVGLGTSRTMHEMTGFFSPSKKLPNCIFVEMVGGIAAEDPRFDIYNVSWNLAQKCGGTARHLFTPAALDTPQARDVMMADKRVAETLNLAASSDLSLLAVGDTGKACPIFKMASLSDADFRDLKDRGAVGEIIGRAYDVQGNAVSTSIDDRVLGLTLDQIRALPFVVAVGGGSERADAILGALRQGLVNVLVTDAGVGRSLMDAD